MEVRYTLTLRNYVTFLLYEARKSRGGRAHYFFWWAVPQLLCVAGAVWVFQFGDDNAYPFTVILALISGFYVVMYPTMYREWMRAYVKKMGTQGITGSVTLVLTEELLISVTEVIRSEIRWEIMKGMEEVGDCTYIFVTEASIVMLFRSGFDTDEEYFAVRDFALRKLGGRAEG